MADKAGWVIFFQNATRSQQFVWSYAMDSEPWQNLKQNKTKTKIKRHTVSMLLQWKINGRLCGLVKSLIASTYGLVSVQW